MSPNIPPKLLALLFELVFHIPLLLAEIFYRGLLLRGKDKPLTLFFLLLQFIQLPLRVRVR